LIKVLVNESQMAGIQAIQWDGTDHYGQKVSSGIYLYQLQTRNEVQVGKMILVK